MKQLSLRSLFVLPILVACASRSPRAPDAAEILARHLEWSGGADVLNRLTDLTMTGTLAVASLEGPIVLQMSRVGLMRLTYDLGVVAGAEGIDERGGWRQAGTGAIESLPPDDFERDRREIDIAFGAHVRADARASASYVDRTTVDGVVCDHVRFQSGGAGVVEEAYFGADGALIATRDVRDGQETWTHYSSWRVVGGRRFPFEESAVGEQKQVIRWTTIEANRRLDALTMARPSERALAGTASGKDVTLALDLVEDSYLYVTGELNGKATDIVIDSGAGITVVDLAFAQAIGLEGNGEITARGAGGEDRKVQLARDVKIRLGTLELKPMTVAILDLEEVHSRVGRRMPVILGKELFQAFPITVDYGKRKVTVHDAEHFEPPANSVAAPTRPFGDHGHVMIEARFEDLEPAWFVVDTGSGDTVALHTPYVRSNSLLQHFPRQGELLFGGVGGSLKAKTAVAKSFTLAGQVFDSVPVTLATEDKGVLASEGAAGTLGAGLLSRFTVTFDYPRKRLLFEPNLAEDKPFPKERAGIFTDEKDGALVVILVAAGSPAELAGIAVGDRIVAIDGASPKLPELRAQLRKAVRMPVGTTIRLALSNGAERVLSLADYF